MKYQTSSVEHVTERFVDSINELHTQHGLLPFDVIKKCGLTIIEYVEMQEARKVVHRKAVCRLVEQFPVNVLYIELGAKPTIISDHCDALNPN